MADDDIDTTLEAQDGTQDDAASGSADAAKTGSTGDGDVSLWKNRLNGQTAKTNEALSKATAAEARAAAAEQKLADYESGKLGEDDALKAQLVAEKARADTAERKASLSVLQSKFPEAFLVFGEDIVGMSAEKLAEAEARFTSGSDAGSDDLPTPRRHNEKKDPPGVTTKKVETANDVEARLLAMTPPDHFTN